MKLWCVLALGCAIALAAGQAANPANPGNQANPGNPGKQANTDRGRREEQRSCFACHSLRLVDSQRLSRATWNKELDKMTNWGAKIQDRDALLEYLAAKYGDDKPAAPPAMSGDGSRATDRRNR
jgi:mono/diheme cytochrome c family protein